MILGQFQVDFRLQIVLGGLVSFANSILKLVEVVTPEVSIMFRFWSALAREIDGFASNNN